YEGLLNGKGDRAAHGRKGFRKPFTNVAPISPAQLRLSTNAVRVNVRMAAFDRPNSARPRFYHQYLSDASIRLRKISSLVRTLVVGKSYLRQKMTCDYPQGNRRGRGNDAAEDETGEQGTAEFFNEAAAVMPRKIPLGRLV